MQHYELDSILALQSFYLFTFLLIISNTSFHRFFIHRFFTRPVRSSVILFFFTSNPQVHGVCDRQKWVCYIDIALGFGFGAARISYIASVLSVLSFYSFHAYRLYCISRQYHCVPFLLLVFFYPGVEMFGWTLCCCRPL